MNGTSYALVQLDPSGDVYALWINDGAVEGQCGPLTYTEQDEPFWNYEFDYEEIDDWDGINFRTIRTD